MKNPLEKIYNFDNFRFDGNKFALYYDNRLIKNIGEKPLRVLAVLLENKDNLTSYEEIIKQVWADNPLGVNSVHIAQYISKLRKIFAEFARDKQYIETVKGRGYSFIGGGVTIRESEVLSKVERETPEYEYEKSKYVSTTIENLPETTRGKFSNDENNIPRIFPRSALVFVALIPFCLVLILSWIWFSENDEQIIKRVVEDSQKYESMVLYNAPASVKDEHFSRYWLTNDEFESEFDVKKVRGGVERLIREGKYYGSETKAEQFEIQSVEINNKQNFATVKTLEKWFIAEYKNDGTLLRNKTVGPYFVTYFLKKRDGNWLIEKSTTARAKQTPAQQ